MSPDRERTPEERERARLEREARRAARERGEPLPGDTGSLRLPKLRRPRKDGDAAEGPAPGPGPSAPREPLRPQPPEPRREPSRREPPAAAPRPAAQRSRVPPPEPAGGVPAAPPPGESVGGVPAAPPPGEPVGVEPAVPSPGEPVGAEPAAPPPGAPAGAEPAVPPAREPMGAEPPAPRRAPEPPAGEPPLAPVRRRRQLGTGAGGVDAVRAAREAVAARRRRAGEAGGGGAGPRGGRPADERPRGGGRVVRVLAILAFVGMLALSYVAWQVYQPFAGEGEGRVRVSIPTGASVEQIADILEGRGVIDSARWFQVRVTLGGSRGDLKPGVYQLQREMSFGGAIERLSAGPPNDVVRVVVPEGRSRREIAQIVEDSGLRGSYLRATESVRGFPLRRYRAGDAPNLEGFLFPASYEMKRGASARTLVAEQLQAFRRQFGRVSMRRARSKNLTPYEVLIIASMVEREAQLDKERPIIASVIYNRLSRGEPLGIDATIRYETNNWTEPLRQSDLTRDTPYNTRTRQGLPPTPIGNPGLASIRAAARPASTDYLFYVVKPGTCGEHDFSKTLAEFERDAARYNRERERRGGRSPTDC